MCADEKLKSHLIWPTVRVLQPYLKCRIICFRTTKMVPVNRVICYNTRIKRIHPTSTDSLFYGMKTDVDLVLSIIGDWNSMMVKHNGVKQFESREHTSSNIPTYFLRPKHCSVYLYRICIYASFLKKVKSFSWYADCSLIADVLIDFYVIAMFVTKITPIMHQIDCTEPSAIASIFRILHG